MNSLLYSQDSLYHITATDTLIIKVDNQYNLKSTNIVPFTEEIAIGTIRLSTEEYIFNYRLASFSLSDPVKYALFDTIFVKYKTVLTSLRKEYKRRSLIRIVDKEFPDSIRVIKTEYSPLTSESIFGKEIQRSGSIIRGFTFGSNKDFSLDSGLRLQLSGKLAEDIDIVAALSDENTPIQPEGNTETLEELDKVFIQVNHTNASGTFGDYDLSNATGEFGKVSRKLQGLKTEFKFKDYSGTFAVAGSRGKFNSIQFNGDDGNQGPYRLNGINNERDIIVVAGSERVYLDGEEMKRGENKDYIIEYANAELTFTPNRLITSASRIIVDFEYSDRQYERNFIGGSFNGTLWNNRLNVGVSFYRESDDENNPVDLSLSEYDKLLLKTAGDDRELAARDGATVVSPDSTGASKGVYTKIDTVIDGKNYTYYKYMPGEPLAIYNVTFSYLGPGKGDYISESTGRYKFIGINKGSYLPVKYIPLAQSKQHGNVMIKGEIFKDLNLTFEVAGSEWDKNKLSDMDDDDNFGFSRNLSLSFLKNNFNFGLGEFKNINISVRDRYVDKRFTSLDRYNEVEFERYYNTGTIAITDEYLTEAAVNISPVSEILFSSLYGHLKRNGQIASDRYNARLVVNNFHNLSMEYNFDYVSSNTGNFKTNWDKQNGFLKYNFSNLVPGVFYLYESRKDYSPESDSLLTGSLRYLEIGPTLDLLNYYGFKLSASYTLREESSPLAGKMVNESHAESQTYSIVYNGIKGINSSVDLALRNKEYTARFRELGFVNSKTALLKSKTRINSADDFVKGQLYYEASTQKTARLEKVFIRVQQGTGNYVYLGDLNDNGISEEEEFEPTFFEGDYILTTIPTDELFPVIDLKFNTNWLLEFNRYFRGNSLPENILKVISTETTYRVEEKNKNENVEDIYLLRFSKFLNEEYTISGFNFFEHDFNLFKNNEDISMRLRFTERNNLTQYSGGQEKGYFNEKSFRLNVRLIEAINNLTEYSVKRENVSAPVNLNRSRNVLESTLTTEFSYRPVRNLEIGFRVSTGEITDVYPTEPTRINQNSQLLRLTISFTGRGRIRFEAERVELVAKNTGNIIPFEITRGNVLGKNYIWRSNIDYRISTNLQTTLTYFGRKLGQGDAIHSLRAEARAFF
ncbi:MAG: hypothetical protein JW995_12350 [Melioribacteraceae bacterium]|nr:hypothetical protein [Melioribacteraceae bacterium]